MWTRHIYVELTLGLGLSIEAPLWSSDLGRGLDSQPPQSPEGQEIAQDGGHQGLSPQEILAALLASERGRRAVTSFCEQIMLRKEAAEKVRVRSSHPERIDRRGRGRRRGHAWTRRSWAAAPGRWGSKLGADRSAPRDCQAVR